MNGAARHRSARGSAVVPWLIKLVIVLALVLLAFGLWRKWQRPAAGSAPAVAASAASQPAARRPANDPNATPAAVVATPVTRWASLDNLFIQRPVIAAGDELEIVAQWRFGADAGRWIHIDCEIRSTTEPSAAPLPCAMSAENRNILVLPLAPGSYQFGMSWALDGHASEQRKLRFDVLPRSRNGSAARASSAASGANPLAVTRPAPKAVPPVAARQAPPAEGRVRTPDEQMDDLSRR